MKLTSAQRAEVNLKLDIVSLLDQKGLSYRQESGRVKIHCPFHAGDNDPSLVIYSGNRPMTWFCFGCRLGTDALEFFRLFLKKPAEDIAKQYIQTNTIETPEDKIRSILETRPVTNTMQIVKDSLSIEISMKARSALQESPGRFQEIQSILMDVDDFLSMFDGDTYDMRLFVKNAEKRIRRI